MKSSILTSICIPLIITSSASAAVIANFDFTGPPWTSDKEADFATFSAAAGSVDTELNSTVSNLSKTADIDSGGYLSYYIRDADIGTSIFSNTTTAGVGMNFADLAETSATDYISFTVTPNSGFQATYENLTLFLGTNKDDMEFELRAHDGSSESTLATYSFVDTNTGATNDPIIAHDFDFVDFTSSGAVEFRLYAYGALDENQGARIDDVILNGVVAAVPEPSTLAFLVLAGLGILARRRR